MDPTSVERLFQRAEQLSPGDAAGAQHILNEGVALRLPRAKLRELQAVLRQSTRLDPDVLKAMAADARLHHPTHGLLDDPHKVACAVRAEIEASHGPVVFADGCLWWYAGNPDSEGFGAWHRFELELLDRFLLTRFRHPLLVSAAGRREVGLRLLAECEEPDAFGSAMAAICLRDRALAYLPDVPTIRAIDHAPEHRLRFKVPVVFDPDAGAPRLMAKLLRVLGTPQRVQGFMEFLACAVFRRTPPNDPVRTCLVLHGAARSGKSTLIGLAESFFADHEVAHLPPDVWGKPEHVIGLAGRAINTVPELSAVARYRGVDLKKVLSMEPVMGRHLYRNSVTFVPRLLHFFACNELPRIDEKNNSLARRFMVLHFPEPLSDEEASEDFWAIVEAEKAGFINELANAFGDVQVRGRFDLPGDSDAFVRRMQHGGDLAALFARECLERAPGHRISASDLLDALRRFAPTIGMDPDTVNHGTCRLVLKESSALYRATDIKSGGLKYHANVQLRPEWAGPAHPAADNDLNQL